MREVRFSRGARQQLADIAEYLLATSGDIRAGTALVLAIEARMLKLASLSATIGRPRPDLGDGLRSLPHGAYLVFFRYAGERLDVLHVIHKRRDVTKYFRRAGG